MVEFPDSAAQYALYRERRERAVTAPQGNLALVNTQWVAGDDTAAQVVRGVPGSWSPLPAGQSGLRVTAPPAANIRVDGVVVDSSAIVRGKDSDEPSKVIFSDTVTGFVIGNEHREYALRVWDANSDGIREFERIDAFPFDPDWVIEATFVPNDDGATIGIEHLKDEGKTRNKVVPGDIVFERGGTTYRIAAFHEGSALLLVFADTTTGDSTYAVGRFLMVAPRADGAITLDFNRAFLPPCAFSQSFNCPMPPPQNRFRFAIEAGEKNVLNRSGGVLHA